MNKLHVILGLLETNQVEDAKQYIMKTNLVSGEAISDISHRVPIANLAALLIGKLIQASELGITLNLKPDSFFHQKEHHLPVDCYITIVGNLLENAMYELNRKEFEVKQIDLGIYSEEGHTIIVCEDTGGGIPEEVLFSIYDRNTTTKGEGHGTGMALIREIVDMYEGTIHIDTDEGEGTCFEIVLPI
jgi:CitB family two-component system sensor histidine kinase MalK/two-component system sensor histidine kinase DctS